MELESAGSTLRAIARGLGIAAILVCLAAAFAGANAQSSVRPPDTGVSSPVDPSGSSGPANTLGSESDADIWREIKQGGDFNATARGPNAGQLVQTEGQIWREINTGTLPRYGAWAIFGVIAALALFFAIGGRLRIHKGWSGITITRFTALERAGHWLTAGSFVILAATGLNLLYGRHFVLPLIGPEAFAAITQWGKYLHNYVAFAFIAGLVFLFLHWFTHNIPNRHDLVWLLKGGGIIFRNVHVPARKFNAGQKIIFWLTIFGGASVALSGWALLFPFTTHFMTDTFEIAGRIGIDIPGWIGLPEPPYSAMMEQQMNQVWHGAMSLLLTAVIIAHVYIGSVGMEGAFQAMGTGQVDYNWAREHHDLWVAELERREADKRAPPAAAAQEPAE
jgi:formate dehydrogenase subunit gamma